jgi:hypothetical protein
MQLVASSDEQAIAIRDHILPLLRMNGSIGRQRDSVRLTEFRTGGWLFQHWTPFSELGREEASSPGYRHALQRQHSKAALPYGIDIWQGQKHVLRVLWADGGPTAIETFVRGPWEEEVLLL